MRRVIAAALVLLALAPVSAWASAWTTDPVASAITFRYILNGEAREGVFHKFQASGAFDQDAPEAADLDLRVQTRSIDLNNTLASAYATSAEWFDSKNHPDVQFRLAKLTHLGGSRYLAEGPLTIRGAMKPTSLELTLTFENGVARARGTLTIARRDFWLGYGPSMAVVDVGPDVAVDFDLSARQR